MTTLAAQTGGPSVRAWRKRLRAARREHHDRTLRDTLTDAYTAFWFLLIYGGALYSEVSRHLSTPGAMEGAVERHWLVVAALLAVAGLAWRGLRSVGPMLATPAERYWAISTPLPRGRWLMGRFVGVMTAGALAGMAAAVGVVVLGLRRGGVGTAASAGAAYGLALVAGAVVAQRASGRRWPGALGGVLLAAAGMGALAVVAAHFGGAAVPSPPAGTGGLLLAVGIPAAGVSLWRAATVLPRLDRGRLGAGAQVAAAAVTAAVWLDVTVLSGVLEVRRWRRVGRVRSRRWLRPVPGVPTRIQCLVQADLLRTLRRPGAMAVWTGLILAQYGVVVAAPSLAGVSRILLAYLAAGRLMAGLRTVARSDGLRRSLGGSEAALRGAHVVVPGLLALIWWGATAPAGGAAAAGVEALLAVGVVAGAYRAATRGPMDYEAGIVETPFGPLPVGLVMQLGRGPDLLGAVILVRILTG